jgi:HPt (histidine-containing phosphotransfer) domain-containing protein
VVGEGARTTLDELRARFMGRFLETARGRVQRTAEALAREDARGAWSEMHALAGEAAILGVTNVADLARACGASAKRRMGGGDVPSERTASEAILRELEAALASLG